MNPQKLAGQCGKLKCCLNFENDNYKEESKKFPPTQQRLKTKSGEAFFQKMDILSGMMWYSPTDNPSNYIPIFRDDVKKIQDMNAKGKTPDSLDDFTEVKDEGIKYDNVIGQDDLTRFDKKEKRPNNKNRNRKPRNNRSKNNNTARANNNNKANKNSNKKNYNSSNNKTRENKANSGKKQ
jgi:hypothetical protein